MLAFVAAEIFKAKTAAKIHTKYLSDYEWARLNLDKDALVYPPEMEFAYALDRYSFPELPENVYSGAYDNYTVYYFWYEQEGFDALDKSQLQELILLHNLSLVYKSNITEVEIYR